MRKLTSAEQHKNTLLEYDRTSEKRTQVIDDESDYFSIDSQKWLNQEQRQKLKQKEAEIWQQKHGSRLNKKYNFDFAGRQIIEDVPDIYKDEELKAILESNNALKFKNQGSNIGDVANPNVPRPMYVEENPGKSTSGGSKLGSEKPLMLKIQDAQLQVMRDDGWCLTMHQPWASYLVSGIKVHEGRTWYSPHRGRLWIHAASKVSKSI